MAIVLLFVLVIYVIVLMLRRHGDGIVPKRGTGVKADLGALADTPRVRMRAVTAAGPDRVRVVLIPQADETRDLDFVVGLGEDEFGFRLLQEWQQSGCLLALVIPPDSRLVRLRSVDDLQHLTLRRVDEG